MSVASYSRMQIRLHWAVVGLVAIQFLFGEGMAHAFDAFVETGQRAVTLGAGLHILSGLLILVLAFWRLGLRFLHGVPDPDPSHSKAQVMLARVIFGLFYILMVLLPVSGFIAFSQGSEVAADLHSVLRVVMLLLIVLHVAAALAGQFVKKDGSLMRIMKPSD
jgi:cytochrome b561